MVKGSGLFNCNTSSRKRHKNQSLLNFFVINVNSSGKEKVFLSSVGS